MIFAYSFEDSDKDLLLLINHFYVFLSKSFRCLIVLKSIVDPRNGLERFTDCSRSEHNCFALNIHLERDS